MEIRTRFVKESVRATGMKLLCGIFFIELNEKLACAAAGEYAVCMLR